MNAQEIKDLIQSKIAGQGNQVDSGGALAEILDAIIDNMGGEVTINEGGGYQEITQEEYRHLLTLNRVTLNLGSDSEVCMRNDLAGLITPDLGDFGETYLNAINASGVTGCFVSPTLSPDASLVVTEIYVVLVAYAPNSKYYVIGYYYEA